MKTDSALKMIGPWNWADVGQRANCPPLAGHATSTHRVTSQVTAQGAISVKTLLQAVQDSRYSDSAKVPEDHWLRVTKKRSRGRTASEEVNEQEQTASEPETPQKDKEERSQKRRKESRSPKEPPSTTTPGVIDPVGPLPGFITAEEHRKKMSALEKAAKKVKRVNFAEIPVSTDSTAEKSEVQASRETTLSTSQSSMISATESPSGEEMNGTEVGTNNWWR
jgi:hypothetical protein